MTDDTPPTTDYTSPEYYAWYDAHMQAQVDAFVHEAVNALGTPHSDAQAWQLSAYVAVRLAQEAVNRPDQPLQVPSDYQDASAQRVMDYLYAQVSALRNGEESSQP